MKQKLTEVYRFDSDADLILTMDNFIITNKNRFIWYEFFLRTAFVKPDANNESANLMHL